MKKIIFILLSCLAVFGCRTDLKEGTEPEADSISVFPEEWSFDHKGGTIKVVVTSNGEWALKAKDGKSYDWVTLSATSGADGDFVEFTAIPNEGEEKLTAEYVFTLNDTEAAFTLHSLPKPEEDVFFNLKSEQNPVVGHAAGSLEILVNSSFAHGEVSCSVSEENKTWLVHRETVKGTAENEVRIVFEYTALEGLADRSGTIVISAEGATPVSVNVLQEAEEKLEAVQTEYTAKKEGETLDVALVSNVGYEAAVTFEEGVEPWITVGEKTAGEVSLIVDAVAEGLRTATLTLTQNDAKEGKTPLTASVTITQEAMSLKLISEATQALGFAAGELEILVKSGISHRDLACSVSEEDGDWLSHTVNLPGEGENEAKLIFSYKALEGLADRDAVITISGEGVEPLTVTVIQEAEHKLEATQKFYTSPKEGGEINVALVSNVAYKTEVSYEEGVSPWITVGEATAEGVTLTAATLESGKRVATVTFTQTDAKEGETPLATSVQLTQMEEAVIKWAAQMTNNRLFPKWTDGCLKDTEEFTLETLVRIDDFDKPSGGIMTIMGIEGIIMVRLGDSGYAQNRLQVVMTDRPSIVGYGNEFKCEPDFLFEAKRWYHIAVGVRMNGGIDSFGDMRVYAGIRVYVDGEQIANYTTKNFYPSDKKKGINLSPNYRNSESADHRMFWLGYAFNPDRDLHGQITETRIWTKRLSSSEINAPGHFYSVDPASEGLYTYWKFTEGSGSTIADATGNGHPLYGQTDVSGTPADGIEWVSVSLPEK